MKPRDRQIVRSIPLWEEPEAVPEEYVFYKSIFFYFTLCYFIFAGASIQWGKREDAIYLLLSNTKYTQK